MVNGIEKKNELTITVNGAAGSGKSRLTYLLKNFLEKEGFLVDLDIEIDFKNQEIWEQKMEKNYPEALESIRERTLIVLQENYIQRKNEEERINDSRRRRLKTILN